jgi:outer membrane protein OmpA-like peptidoglycan-associated protein
MRRLLLALCALPFAAPAFAQVSTNDQALDSLKSAPAAHAEQSRSTTTRTRRAGRHATAPASVQPHQKVPQVPAGPPPNPVIAPAPLVMPNHPPPPPPPVPLRADATGAATRIAGGTRITFAAGGSTLNPSTFNAIKAVAEAAKANPAMTIDVTAWAPGKPDDPSTPRRLSLDRALAVRAVLIGVGVASERIHAIAKGMTDIGAAPADRADLLTQSPPRSADTSPPAAQQNKTSR